MFLINIAPVVRLDEVITNLTISRGQLKSIKVEIRMHSNMLIKLGLIDKPLDQIVLEDIRGQLGGGLGSHKDWISCCFIS